jgi:hypothetical protein
MAGYTVVNLREVEDMAVKHGLDDVQEARFPQSDLDAESTGLGLIRVKPGKRQAFAHRHNEAEEVSQGRRRDHQGGLLGRLS